MIKFHYIRRFRQRLSFYPVRTNWSKDFLAASKKRLSGDTEREANTTEVKGLRTKARQLKEALAEQVLENRLLKKSVIGDGEDDI
jgi:transposase